MRIAGAVIVAVIVALVAGMFGCTAEAVQGGKAAFEQRAAQIEAATR